MHRNSGTLPLFPTGLDFRIALLISLPIIAFGISKPVRWLASPHNERTLLRTAWANNWLEFYPVLVGNFYHFDTKEEKNPVGDDHYYFHQARIMVFFPDGSTEVLPELANVKAVDYPPELMRSDGTAIADNPDELRVSPSVNNGDRTRRCPGIHRHSQYRLGCAADRSSACPSGARVGTRHSELTRRSEL